MPAPRHAGQSVRQSVSDRTNPIRAETPPPASSRQCRRASGTRPGQGPAALALPCRLSAQALQAVQAADEAHTEPKNSPCTVEKAIPTGPWAWGPRVTKQWGLGIPNYPGGYGAQCPEAPHPTAEVTYSVAWGGSQGKCVWLHADACTEEEPGWGSCKEQRSHSASPSGAGGSRKGWSLCVGFLSTEGLRVTSTPPHFETDPWWQLLGEHRDVSIRLSKEIAPGSSSLAPTFSLRLQATGSPIPPPWDGAENEASSAPDSNPTPPPKPPSMAPGGTLLAPHFIKQPLQPAVTGTAARPVRTGRHTSHPPSALTPHDPTLAQIGKTDNQG
ncbi:hypothetical protein P4O66_003294 [Electrophorus voltai]|uniref:Uncharacterized protein n=1 Tax=Electrophorus voltai TaxID=2609070 RepID=A0AAD8YP05_9TELE|nr:hypothetical protein P4O66_003294 [Electrophorus voltai]